MLQAERIGPQFGKQPRLDQQRMRGRAGLIDHPGQGQVGQPHPQAIAAADIAMDPGEPELPDLARRRMRLVPEFGREDVAVLVDRQGMTAMGDLRVQDGVVEFMPPRQAADRRQAERPDRVPDADEEGRSSGVNRAPAGNPRPHAPARRHP